MMHGRVFQDYERFFCVTGHCIDSRTGQIIGGVWPKGINELKGKKQRRVIFKNKKGEKICCRKVEILRKFPFPNYPGIKFIFEGTVWRAIEQEYDQYCINEVLRVYHTESEGSLVKSRDKSFMYAGYYLSLSRLNNSFGNITYEPQILLSVFYVSRYAICLKIPYKETMKEINKWYKKLLVTMAYPLMWGYNIFCCKEGK